MEQSNTGLLRSIGTAFIAPSTCNGNGAGRPLAIALGIAYLSSAVFGVSFALGAFLAGAVVGESDMSHQAAFFMRATPIEQVRAVSGAGETMPPKSTFFYPKLLSGMAFNPLS